MSLKNYVVEGCTLTADTGVGNIQITSASSQKIKIDSMGVYAGSITISITGLSGSGFSGGSGIGILTGSAQHNKVDSQPVVLEGDQSEKILVQAVNGDGEPITVPTVVTITVAGQIIVKGD